MPRTSLLSGLVGGNSKELGLERGALAAMARAQRVSFSAEEGGGAGGTKNKVEQAQAGMDAETRRSIGEGDKKSEKSMKTVKVGTSKMRHSRLKSLSSLGPVVVDKYYGSLARGCS